MKIGILTQPLHNNYGGLLQNFALQQVLINAGYTPETIDHDKKRIPFILKYLGLSKLLLLHIFKPSKYKLPRYTLSKREFSIISKNTKLFVDKYITHTKPFSSYKELKKIVKNGKYEGFIVGSDQVWRPNYNDFQTAMFLDFVENMDVKRIAYAASFGTSSWEFSSQMTDECAQLARRFDLITVREKSGLTLCREHFGVDATQVLDPTMLLNREDYEKVVMAENEPKSAGTLFYYILDPNDEKRGLIERLAIVKGLQPFTIMPKCQAETRTKWDVKHRIEDCIFPSVTSWLRGFMDAELIVVDSFHGAVFSIIFNKPFWVIGNSMRGNARFESLLKMYGLEYRMIDPTCEVDWDKEIDWVKVNNIRKTERNRSIDLLIKSLS